LSDGRKKEIYQDVRFFHGAIQFTSFVSFAVFVYNIEVVLVLFASDCSAYYVDIKWNDVTFRYLITLKIIFLL